MCYIGKRRSENSLMAIMKYEMPLSMVNKSVIHNLINSRKSLRKEDAERLHNLTLQQVKFICKQMGATSWHHTGNTYVRALHYDLNKMVDYILENGLDNLLKLYKEKEGKNSEKLFKD